MIVLKELNRQNAVSRSDVAKMEHVVREHLIETSPGLVLPDTAQWNADGNVNRVLELILRVCDDTVSLRGKDRAELGEREGQLTEQQSRFRGHFKRLERGISMKRQHLQELGAAISDETLAMKDERRRHLLAVRPKYAQLERLEGRRKLAKRD